MSEVLVVVVKGTGIVLAGVTRTAGGTLPSVAELVEGTLSVELGSSAALFEFPIRALEVRRITAPANDVVDCASKTVEGTTDDATFSVGANTLEVTLNNTPRRIELTNTVPEALNGTLTIVDADGEFVVDAQPIAMAQNATKKLFPVTSFRAPYAVYVTNRALSILV